jgi:hypothetical protein
LTPKLSLNAAVSRLVSPATSILSNLQLTESATVGLTYQCTPKLSLSANVQASYITGSVGGNSVNTINPLLLPLTSNENAYSAQAKVAYAMTPFLSSSLSYQYYKTVQANLTTTTSVILLALNFNPY